MCERCERNTQVKRAIADVLYRQPADGDADARAIPGFVSFLALCRRMETLTRAPGIAGQPDPEEATLFRAAVTALTAEERSNVLRVAQYVKDMAESMRVNIGTAKLELQDQDSGITLIRVTLEEGSIVLRRNGEVISRTELEVGQDPDAALDAADRAMRAHRDLHGAP